MAQICDFCETRIAHKEGYLLPTRTVATSTAFWRYFLADYFAHDFRFSELSPAGQKKIIAIVASEAGPWRACQTHAHLFTFDRRKARDLFVQLDAGNLNKSSMISQPLCGSNRAASEFETTILDPLDDLNLRLCLQAFRSAFIFLSHTSGSNSLLC